jgi:hypothetical protein
MGKPRGPVMVAGIVVEEPVARPPGAAPQSRLGNKFLCPLRLDAGVRRDCVEGASVSVPTGPAARLSREPARTWDAADPQPQR